MTFCLCKPIIRRGALPGDILVSVQPRTNRIIFVAKVKDILHFRDYARWCSENAPRKIHSKANPRGDCLWQRQGDQFRRRPSVVEHLGVALQLQEVPVALIMEGYSYWGFQGPDSEFLGV